MRKSLKVGTICMNSGTDVVSNIDKALELAKSAVDHGASWVVLPEMFPFIGPNNQTFRAYSDFHEKALAHLSDFAKTHQVVLFGGTVGIPTVDSKLLNTLLVFDRDGTEISRYEKTHLFELFDDKGQVSVTEKTCYAAGHKPVTCEVDGFHVGLSICYDIRFSGLYQTMSAKKPLDVIMLPSAFTKLTGQGHWELLLRYRAIEQQSYVIGAAQTGEHFPGRESYGEAMIVAPWGEVVDNTGLSVGVAMGEIIPERILEARTRLPLRLNRRDELYKA